MTASGLRATRQLVTGLIGRELRREELPAGTFGDLGQQQVLLATTADRSVLGCMNDMAFRCEHAARRLAVRQSRHLEPRQPAAGRRRTERERLRAQGAVPTPVACVPCQGSEFHKASMGRARRRSPNGRVCWPAAYLVDIWPQGSRSPGRPMSRPSACWYLAALLPVAANWPNSHSSRSGLCGTRTWPTRACRSPASCASSSSRVRRLPSGRRGDFDRVGVRHQLGPAQLLSLRRRVHTARRSRPGPRSDRGGGRRRVVA